VRSRNWCRHHGERAGKGSKALAHCSI